MSDPASDRADFGDPSFEPTDDQLRALAKEAFAGVAERRRAALEAFNARIAALRAEVLVRVRAREGP